MERTGLRNNGQTYSDIMILAVLLVVMAIGAVCGGDQILDLVSGT
jgi:hypothetical protein